MLIGLQANAIGRLQDADFKTLTQITNAGGTAASLLNDSKIYVSANGINQTLNSAIGSGLIGGGAGVNLVSNGTFEASGIAGWSTFQTTLTGQLPTTAPATCASCSIAISANTAAPLNGKASLQMVGASSITAGHGFISAPFTISPAYQGQVLSIKGLNSLVSGAPRITGDSTGTFAIYAYDVTNAQWIQPAGAFGIVSSAGPFAPGSFQVPANTTSMRLAVVAINTLATPATLLFDDLSVSPGTTTVGPALSDTKPYVCTTNLTAATCAGRYRQVGEYIEGQVTVTATGTPGAVTIITASIPSGMAIDAIKTASNGQTTLGIWAAQDVSAASTFAGDVYYSSANSIQLGFRNGSAVAIAASASTPFATAVSDYYIMNYRVPIVGFSTNVQQSSDFDGRATTWNGTLTGTPAITANTQAIPYTTTIDRAGAWTTTQYVTPVQGDYAINGNLTVNAVSATIDAYVDGVKVAILGANNTAVAAVLNLAGTLTNLRANQVITVRTSASLTANGGLLNIYRIAGAQPIQVQPSLTARYASVAGTSIPSGGTITVPYGVKSWDDGNNYNGTTYTCGMSGKLEINATATVQTTITTGQLVSMQVQKNGANAGTLDVRWGNGNNLAYTLSGSDTYVCTVGDTFIVQVSNGSSGAGALSTNAALNHVTFKRVAN